MDIVRWDPFRELGSLRSELNRLFVNGGGVQMETWTPSVDVVETDDAIKIKAELPEVEKKDIDVSIDGDVLTLSGERRLEKEEKKEDYRRIERSYGKFSRSFMIPENVDRTAIKAEAKDGVLKLTLPKAKKSPAERKKIAIG
jgi:HSP20 family protein